MITPSVLPSSKFLGVISFLFCDGIFFSLHLMSDHSLKVSANECSLLRKGDVANKNNSKVSPSV